VLDPPGCKLRFSLAPDAPSDKLQSSTAGKSEADGWSYVGRVKLAPFRSSSSYKPKVQGERLSSTKPCTGTCQPGSFFESTASAETASSLLQQLLENAPDPDAEGEVTVQRATKKGDIYVKR